eukprot:PhF_6_TR4858/c0_g1_i2/m.6812
MGWSGVSLDLFVTTFSLGITVFLLEVVQRRWLCRGIFTGIQSPTWWMLVDRSVSLAFILFPHQVTLHLVLRWAESFGVAIIGIVCLLRSIFRYAKSDRTARTCQKIVFYSWVVVSFVFQFLCVRNTKPFCGTWVKRFNIFSP